MNVNYSTRAHQIAAIARLTLLEAWRTRLLGLFTLLVILIFGLSLFVQSLAIIEATRTQIVLVASITRLAAVFVLALYILTVITREFNDKGLELVLSFDLPRSAYITGRLAGFALIGLALAVLAASPQLVLAFELKVLIWALSLALELVIVAAFSLFCIATFMQLIPAATAVIGFYLLARVITAVRLMSDTPTFGSGSLSHQVMSYLVDALALIMPALDRYAQSSWLVAERVDGSLLGQNAIQTTLFVMVLAAATMVDFYRKNI